MSQCSRSMPAGPPTTKHEVEPGLAALLEEPAEALGVEGLAVGRQQHGEGAIGQALRHLLVLAHLDQLDPRVPRESFW